MRTEQKPRDLPGMILAAVFIAVGAWVLFQSQGLSALGSVFPRTIAIALIVFSLALIAVNLRRAPRPRAPLERAAPESTPRRLGLVVIMGAWGLLLPVIGFFVSSVLAFVALLIIAEYDRWTARRTAIYGLTAVLVVAAFYFLMRDILLIPVPRGIFF